ncbi:TonB-dependent receptor [Catenovulum agarivorans DS-2]|uniref:TonB-dependent receptor n=1 Tax=Catenovulum agarivorans DS-2 TaxID=1328313 RepID=W7QTS7_9ALTE|nr:TonB-dependent receptor [Catenovulum agarivorans]EWH08835.1 TonB-dependent receptor [Catenovulum agarivorans DS-2]
MAHKTISQKPAFKLSLVAAAITVTGAVTPLQALAEGNSKTESEVETIEIRGARGSLISAQAIKRDGETVMDVISAKDIGSLPDRSVLEAVVRLPGVSIERFAGANDPDHFSVEGSGVVIRGLTHTRSEFNGRDTFTADSGRGLSFQDVPPELMGGVELYKNQSADMIEGGIAGTVNLVTRKPFDSKDRVLAFTADATYSDFIEETTPTYSGLYSDIFTLDAGRLGILLNYSNSNLKAQSDGTQIGKYYQQNRQVGGKDVFVPETTRLTRKKDDRDREGLAASLQWENTDRTLLITGQYIRSDSSNAWTENAIEMADDAVIKDLIPAEGTEFEYSDQGLFESGLITSTAGWRGNGEPERLPGGIFGPQHAMITRHRDTDSVVEDIGVNIKYRPNDSWSFNLDLQQVDAETTVNDYSLMGATRAVVGIKQQGVDTPKISLFDPAYQPDAQSDVTDHFTNPHNYFWRSAMEHISDNEGKEKAFAADAQYTFEDGLIASIKVGARYAKREQVTRQSKYNWGWLSEAWAGNGNAWFDAEGDELGANLNKDYQQVTFDDFAKGDVLNTSGGNSFLFPTEEIVKDYANWQDRFSSLSPGWNPLAARDRAVGHFIPNEINDTKEQNSAVYIKANFDGEMAGMPFSGNFGVRYVKIENQTEGFVTFPDTVGKTNDDGTADLTDPDWHLPADQAAFGNGAFVPQTGTSEYTNVLPSFNLKVNLADDLILRFGFSEAIALPDLGNLRNYVEISEEDQIITYQGEGDNRTIVSAPYSRYTAKSGNPNLKPMEAYNYDLALEWYFAEGVGSLTTSLFYKDLSNYFINNTVEREFANNGATQKVLVAGATNGDEGTVRGVEFAYQQFFDFLPASLSGLGMQFNYTYIEEEGSPNSNLAPDKPNSAEGEGVAYDNLPLEGLSKNNYNLVAMYEKYGVSARLAYNWRSDYLLTTKDVITELPIYNEASGQLDGSIFYSLNDNIQIGLQGTNLTDEVTRTSMQVDQAGNRAGRSWFVNDRRISFVVKGNF